MWLLGQKCTKALHDLELIKADCDALGISWRRILKQRMQPQSSQKEPGGTLIPFENYNFILFCILSRQFSCKNRWIIRRKEIMLGRVALHRHFWRKSGKNCRNGEHALCWFMPLNWNFGFDFVSLGASLPGSPRPTGSSPQVAGSGNILLTECPHCGG